MFLLFLTRGSTVLGGDSATARYKPQVEAPERSVRLPSHHGALSYESRSDPSPPLPRCTPQKHRHARSHRELEESPRCRGTARLPRAVDLHVVLGAGADGDAGLQHEEHVETHLHVLFRGDLQKEAESEPRCFPEHRKRE